MQANRKNESGNQESKLCRHCRMEIPQDAKVCPYCHKKQKGKGKWIALGIVVAVILLAAVGGAGKHTAQDSGAQSGASAPQEEMPAASQVVPQETAQPTPTPTEEPAETRYESGMYLVGTDIPAGEYAVFAERSLGYMEVDSDSSGNFDAILCNENFSYNTIVTLEEGRYFSMTGAYAVPLEEAQISTDGNGMFKVGVHIPAGEYKIEVDEDSAMGWGYIEVATDSSHDFNSIRTNDNIESSTYISVSDGEYLTLNGCHIQQ